MAAAWILKKLAHIKTRLAAIAAREGINVAPTAAASSKEPITIVAPLPRRLFSLPDSGPITIPIKYAKYMSVMTSVRAENGGCERSRWEIVKHG